jgi:hypothetical protein
MNRIALGLFTLVAALVMATGAVGCGPAPLPFTPSRTELSIESQSHVGRQLSGRFDRAIYSLDDPDAVTIVLLSGPDDAPTQAAVVRVFWRPRAGATPISRTATNATVQYLIFADAGDRSEVGVYSGAGFVMPRTTLGSGRLDASLWQANLRLADRSAGFDDLLGQALLTGEMRVTRDDHAVQPLLRLLNQRVTDRLGYPRLVEVVTNCGAS